MTTQEFSTEFDILYNNITSNQAPGLNEYEKSVFLTRAQEQLVNEYFNAATDAVGGGFDGGPRRQYDFSSLIKVATLNTSATTSKLDSRSIPYLFPDDYFLAVDEVFEKTVKNEEGDTIAKIQYTVLPISYLEYQRLMMRPFASPVKKAVWRILTSYASNSKQPIAEIIANGLDSKVEEYKYRLRYIPKLTPIILENLSDYSSDLKIDGVSIQTECALPKETHREILDRAVTLAKIVWQGGSAEPKKSE